MIFANLHANAAVWLAFCAVLLLAQADGVLAVESLRRWQEVEGLPRGLLRRAFVLRCC
jgi:hypothetical protein